MGMNRSFIFLLTNYGPKNYFYINLERDESNEKCLCTENLTARNTAYREWLLNEILN